MVISTPRLCNDVAFQPPKGPTPHAIKCHPVMASDSIPSYLANREADIRQVEAAMKEEAKDLASGFFEDIKAALGFDPFEGIAQPTHQGEPDSDWDGPPVEDDTGETAERTAAVKKHHIRIGDMEVGGYNILPPGTKLEKGAAVGGKSKEKLLGTIARSDGFVASDKELSRLKIQSGKELDAIKDKVRRAAGGADWQIDVVETARGKELRGIIADKPDETTDKKRKAGKKPKRKARDGETEKKQRQRAEQAGDDTDDGGDEGIGSEETFKEEL
jgi:protein OS-9